MRKILVTQLTRPTGARHIEVVKLDDKLSSKYEDIISHGLFLDYEIGPEDIIFSVSSLYETLHTVFLSKTTTIQNGFSQLIESFDFDTIGHCDICEEATLKNTNQEILLCAECEDNNENDN